MEKYRIRVELLTDAIFGDGTAVPGVVDSDVLHDEMGFPYMKGKTLKGKIREEFEYLCGFGTGWEQTMCPEDGECLEKLFGKPDSDIDGKLYFSHLQLDEPLRKFFIGMMQESQGTENAIDSEDILESLTSIRSYTAIDYTNGVAKRGSLRRVRMINSGLVFYAEVQSMEKLSAKEEALLGSSVSLLRYLGSLETRGKGQVECRLFYGDQDITDYCIGMLGEV